MNQNMFGIANLLKTVKAKKVTKYLIIPLFFTDFEFLPPIEIKREWGYSDE